MGFLWFKKGDHKCFFRVHGSRLWWDGQPLFVGIDMRCKCGAQAYWDPWSSS